MSTNLRGSWELDSQGATRSETTCLGSCLRVKLSSLGAQGACLALLLRAPSRFYTLSIEILTLFFLGSGASSQSQHLLSKHATSASGLRCTACPLAILRWRCPAIQSLSLVAPRKDSYLNNNPFRGAVGPAAPDRLAWLETPLRRVGSLLKGVGQSPPPLAASKSAAMGQCQVGGPP